MEVREIRFSVMQVNKQLPGWEAQLTYAAKNAEVALEALGGGINVTKSIEDGKTLYWNNSSMEGNSLCIKGDSNKSLPRDGGPVQLVTHVNGKTFRVDVQLPPRINPSTASTSRDADKTPSADHIQGLGSNQNHICEANHKMAKGKPESNEVWTVAGSAGDKQGETFDEIQYSSVVQSNKPGTATSSDQPYSPSNEVIYDDIERRQTQADLVRQGGRATGQGDNWCHLCQSGTQETSGEANVKGCITYENCVSQ